MSSDYYVEDDERACNTDDPDSERYNNMGKIKQELEFEQPVRAEHEEASILVNQEPDVGASQISQNVQEVNSVDRTALENPPESPDQAEQPQRKPYKLLPVSERAYQLFKLESLGHFLINMSKFNQVTEGKTDIESVNENVSNFIESVGVKMQYLMKELNDRDSPAPTIHNGESGQSEKDTRKTRRTSAKSVQNLTTENDSGFEKTTAINEDREIERLVRLDDLDRVAENFITQNETSHTRNKKQKQSGAKGVQKTVSELSLSSIDSLISSNESEDELLENLFNNSSDSENENSDEMKYAGKDECMAGITDSDTPVESDSDLDDGLSDDENVSSVMKENFKNVMSENEVIQEESSQNQLIDDDVILVDDTSNRQSETKRDDRKFNRKLKSLLKESDDSDGQFTEPRKPSITDYFSKTKKRRQSEEDLFSSSTPKKSRNDNSDSTDSENEGPSTKHSKRRKQKILRDDELTPLTQQAQQNEEERLKVLRKKTLELEMIRLTQTEKSLGREDFVLDYDDDRKESLTVDPRLADLLKPHQKEAVQFMYDCCYASVREVKENNGSGCILAHNMGLGKTFSVISLITTCTKFKQLFTSRVLILCPKITVLNWLDEFNRWAKTSNIQKFHFNDADGLKKKIRVLEQWNSCNEKNPGCLVVGYDAFKHLLNLKTAKIKNYTMEELENFDRGIRKCLLDGTDLVILDEGHILKSDKTQISKTIKEIKTMRRILLSGTPFQNNLIEYFHMIDFVKPKFLGTLNEFENMYANPIKNGQNKDSSSDENLLMKKRSLILNRKVSKFLNRKGATILTKMLPEKLEFTVYVPLTPLQRDLYLKYLSVIQKTSKNPLMDHTNLRKIWTHPKMLEMAHDEKQPNTTKKKVSVDQAMSAENLQENMEPLDTTKWWQVLNTDDLESLQNSYKFQIVLHILAKCEEIGDKVVVFSEFVTTLKLLEAFLHKITKQDENPNAEKYGYLEFQSKWMEGVDYFLLEGKTSETIRHRMIQKFNDTKQKKLRLFLVSAKTGGAGINLVGANRCILLDTSWNPATDLQSISRIFRMGQQKKCVIYRLIAYGTMEKHIYAGSVTKQAMSIRVVDKKPIDRNFEKANLSAAYTLIMPNAEDQRSLAMPDDQVLAELLNNFPDKIYNYHTHESLLDNKLEKDLTDSEKEVVIATWEKYEAEERAKAAKELSIVNNNQNESNVGLPVVEYLKSIENIAGPSK